MFENYRNRFVKDFDKVDFYVNSSKREDLNMNKDSNMLIIFFYVNYLVALAPRSLALANPRNIRTLMKIYLKVNKEFITVFLREIL